MVVFEVPVIHLKKIVSLAPLPLSKHAGVSACQPRMPDTRAFAAQSSQFFLGELPEVSKTNMEYFLRIIFSNGERVLGRAEQKRP